MTQFAALLTQSRLTARNLLAVNYKRPTVVTWLVFRQNLFVGRISRQNLTEATPYKSSLWRGEYGIHLRSSKPRLESSAWLICRSATSSTDIKKAETANTSSVSSLNYFTLKYANFKTRLFYAAVSPTLMLGTPFARRSVKKIESISDLARGIAGL